MISDVPAGDTYFKDLRDWMENTLGIPASGKIEDSDWMLVIKLHAMVEAALNSTLVMHFGAPELEKIFGRLDTSDGARGKVAFAKALGMLGSSSAVFLQKLSELRNLCVHNIRNFQFDLAEHIAALEAGERKALLKSITTEIGDDLSIRVKGIEITGSKILEHSLQLGLMAAVMNVMMMLHLHHVKCLARDAETRAQKLKSKLFDVHEQNQSKPKEE